MGTPTRDNKLSCFTPIKKHLSAQLNASNEAGLRLQLENEIDKLALLMQEVRKQSARVQAAADAIGDKVLLEPSEAPSLHVRGSFSNAKLPSIVR